MIALCFRGHTRAPSRGVPLGHGEADVTDLRSDAVVVAVELVLVVPMESLYVFPWFIKTWSSLPHRSWSSLGC
jgi:hypothetical protein